MNSVFYHHSLSLDESNKSFIGYKEACKQTTKNADVELSLRAWIPFEKVEYSNQEKLPLNAKNFKAIDEENKQNNLIKEDKK